MRDVIKSITLFKEIQAEVLGLTPEKAQAISDQAEYRSGQICKEAVNLLSQDFNAVCPVAICSIMEAFPEAIGWAYVLEKNPVLDGWPLTFFKTASQAYEDYAQAMWDSTEETAALMGSEVILQALREGIQEHKLTSFFDCCAAGHWLRLSPEKVATIWLNMCVYTPDIMKEGYKVGDNIYARELFLQRVDHE